MKQSYPSKVRRVLCLFFVSAICLNVFSQTKGDSLLFIADTAKDDSVKALYYEVAGREYNFAGNYEKTMKMAVMALSLYENMGNKPKQALLHDNIGGVYFRMDLKKKTLEHFLKAKALREEAGDTLGLVYSLTNLGVLHRVSKKYEIALNFFKEALDIIERNKIEIAVAKVGPLYNNLALVYTDLGEYRQAMKYHRLSYQVKKDEDNKDGILATLNNMSYLMEEMGNYEKAEELLKESISKGKQWKIAERVQYAYMMIASLYADAGNYKKAYEYRLLFHELKDSLLNKESLAQINELKEKYESEKKDKEIALLHKKEAITKATAERRKYLFLGMGGLALGLVMLVVMLIFRYRINRKRQLAEFDKKKKELEYQSLRSQMNPHFLFNSLNSIQRMYMEGKKSLASEYMGEFSELLRKILDNSSKKTISLHEELKTLELYLTLEKLRTGGQIDFSIDVDPEIDTFNWYIPPLIIQPFAENAIWHGILPKDEKGEVRVEILPGSAGKLVCMVSDDGVGLKPESFEEKKQEGHTSKGMNITRERLGGKGSVRMEERKEGGVIVTIHIPYDLK